MKRFINHFMCFIFMVYSAFLFSGCQHKTNPNSSARSNTNTTQSSSNSAAPKANSGSAVITQGKNLDFSLLNSSLVALFDGNLVLQTDTRTSEMTANHTFFNCNISNGKFINIGTINSFNADSGDMVILNNKNIYLCPLLSDNKNTLFNIDIKGKSITYEKNYKLNQSPLFYFNKIDDSNILIDYSTLLLPQETDNGSDNTYEVNVEIYNTHTKNSTLIISKRFDKNTQSGSLLSCLDLKDNLIYAYTIKGGNGASTDESSDGIDIYDLKGKLQKSIPMPELTKLLKDNRDDHVCSMKVIGNYYYFDTLNQEYLLYKYTGSGLKQLDSEGYLITPFNVVNSISSQFIYFFDYKNNKINVLNGNTGDIRTISFNINGFYYINNFVVDEKGNIVVDLYNKDKNDVSAIHRYYYFNGNELY